MKTTMKVAVKVLIQLNSCLHLIATISIERMLDWSVDVS
jgi:hypothetical protein